MCDGKPDCFNDFDEENCPRCSSGLSAFKYGPKEQCFLSNSKCPENSVTNIILKLAKSIESTGHEYALEDLKPWVVHLDGCGGSYLTPLADNETCPETHVRCPGAYCIPSFTLNNGVRDCPHLDVDDEFVGEDFSCPGHYKCYQSHICINDEFLCDRIYHSPLKDDEVYCQLPCPDQCQCEGYALICSQMINTSRYMDTRYLNLHGVDL